MTTQLKVDFLYAQVDNDIDVIMVGFADDEYDTNEYILLQKSLVVDEQDMEYGFNKVHITYNNEEYSSYGGIKRLKITNGIVDIHLDQRTAKILDTDAHIQIKFPKDYSRLQEIKHYLKQMFEGENEIFVCEV
jgi:hypothetical protein